jgi:hypothetical protein
MTAPYAARGGTIARNRFAYRCPRNPAQSRGTLVECRAF